MKAIVEINERKQWKVKGFGVVKKFLVEPFSNGLYGFALFFSVLLLTKLISVYLGVQDKFVVDFGDVILSLIGFVLLFLVKLLENVGRLKS